MSVEPTPAVVAPDRLHREAYERPVTTRYVDPLDVVWLATATRVGLTIRRDPSCFSRTEGDGVQWFSTREHLDEDDNLGQMLFHEVCHWITNGLDTFTERDWGFALDGPLDPREHAALRLQLWWAGRHGLRSWMQPTGGYRQYTEQVPDDPLAPIDNSAWEAVVGKLAAASVARAQATPRVWEPIDAALAATAELRGIVERFAPDYRSEHDGDTLPLHWLLRHATDR